MAATVLGPLPPSLERDEDGYRTYKITFKVRTDDYNDGPAIVLNASGLPQYGDTWFIGNDVDIWAFCKWNAKVTPVLKDEKNRDWTVELTFDTKPPKSDRCQTTQVEDPLLIPPKISGPFVKYTEEAQYDRFGFPILTSSLELIRGPKAEFDKNRPTIKIEMNVASLQYPLLLSMKDTVNAFPIWGFPPRCVKLSNVGFERKFYGVCFVYYSWNLEFDVMFETFDRDLLDEGTKVLNGHWTNKGVTAPNAATGLWVLDPVGFLPTPNAPTLVANAGAGMPTGTYTYVVTALSQFGETNPSPSTSITVNVGTTTSVNISWNVIQGATGYSIYSKIGSGSFERIKTNTLIIPYTDNGVGAGGPAPPAVNTAGAPPNPKNPQHFIRATDLKGNAMKITLNGAGVPASVISGLQGQFVSIQNSNINHPLSDDNWWILLANPIQSQPWQADEVYEVGQLVTAVNEPNLLFLAVAVSSGIPPAVDDPTHWLFMPNGVSDVGAYMTTTTYTIGQYVADTSGDSAGTVHTEFYPESDFSLLGLPATF